MLYMENGENIIVFDKKVLDFLGKDRGVGLGNRVFRLLVGFKDIRGLVGWGWGRFLRVLVSSIWKLFFFLRIRSYCKSFLNFVFVF